MLATSSASSTLNINGGKYESNANTINIAGPGSKVTINNAELINNDTNPAEDYGTVCTYVTAGGSQITVNGGSVTYNKNDGKGGTGRCLRSCSPDSFSYNTTMIGGGYEACVAYIQYPGETAYAFSTIDGSIEKAKDGETIEIIRDVDMGGQIVDVNKNITIDMNGKKITNGALKLAEGVTVTVVNWPGTEAELEQFLSGKLPVPNRYNVPSTADNSNMPLWAVLFIGFAAVALLTGKKRRA